MSYYLSFTNISIIRKRRYYLKLFQYIQRRREIMPFPYSRYARDSSKTYKVLPDSDTYSEYTRSKRPYNMFISNSTYGFSSLSSSFSDFLEG